MTDVNLIEHHFSTKNSECIFDVRLNPFRVELRSSRRELLRLVSCGFFTSSMLWTTGCAIRNSAITSIRINGSDTMVNLAQGWAERYHRVEPMVEIQVLGAGSGVGIADLADGKCDLATSSRPMKEKEFHAVVEKTKCKPVGYIVGYDAMAMYVHPGNPVKSLSLEQLAEIYGDRPQLTKWSQLTAPNCKVLPKHDEIIPIARQNSSGTYSYFHDTVIGKKRDYRLGTVDANGSKDVVAIVSHTPSAIGYSGMGYKTDAVDWLSLSVKTGGPAFSPTLENARSGKYPITRPLIIYSRGTANIDSPEGKFLHWIYSNEGQELVTQLGYVPVEQQELIQHAFA